MYDLYPVGNSRNTGETVKFVYVRNCLFCTYCVPGSLQSTSDTKIVQMVPACPSLPFLRDKNHKYILVITTMARE